MLNLRVVPYRWKISPQNLLRKSLSRSETMERGMSWSLTTSRTKAAATVTVVKGCLESHKMGMFTQSVHFDGVPTFRFQQSFNQIQRYIFPNLLWNR